MSVDEDGIGQNTIRERRVSAVTVRVFPEGGLLCAMIFVLNFGKCRSTMRGGGGAVIRTHGARLGGGRKSVWSVFPACGKEQGNSFVVEKI